MKNTSLKLLRLLLFVSISCLCIIPSNATQQSLSKPPFIQPDIIHPTTSEFQFNLILNENRHLPIFFVQYSKDFIKETVSNLLKGAFTKEPGISFALLVDCRNLQHNLNGTLNLCRGFDAQKAKAEEKQDLQIQQDKRTDSFFKFQFMAPNPSRIRQKGHQLSKNHDAQNLRQLNNLINDQFLAKVIRNQIADYVTYIQENYDMEQFLEKKAQFRTSKKAKILFFDQNLQAPLFLKKLAARLDGRIKIGVTDNFKLAKKYDALVDAVLLMEYNFDSGQYDTTKISLEQGNQLQSVLNNHKIDRYRKLKKYRDILLDFQHKQVPIYFMQSPSEINQLITYGRIIALQISSEADKYNCPALRQIAHKHSVMINYICFSQSKQALLQKTGLNIKDSNSNSVHIIDQNIKNSQLFVFDSKSFNIFDYLPQAPVRQKISTNSQAQMCIQTAITSQRDPVIYWYNQKEHKNTLKLLQYFNSLPEVNSLIYFCQVFLPDKDLVDRFQLKENSLFSMVNPNKKTGQMHKLEFTEALEFLSIKMFLRQLAINQMIKVYENKLSTNTLVQIKNAQDLTRECFNKQCIVVLMATNKFRFDSQMQTMKELKLQLSQSGFNFVWIDGSCHWDIGKQLKFLSKAQKEIDRSYIFYYKEKSNEYACMTSILENKYWVKKDAKKWIRNIKSSGQIKRMKFGIDIQEKKCDKKLDKKLQTQTNKKPNHQKKSRNQVNQEQL